MCQFCSLPSVGLPLLHTCQCLVLPNAKIIPFSPLTSALFFSIDIIKFRLYKYCACWSTQSSFCNMQSRVTTSLPSPHSLSVFRLWLSQHCLFVLSSTSLLLLSQTQCWWELPLKQSVFKLYQPSTVSYHLQMPLPLVYLLFFPSPMVTIELWCASHKSWEHGEEGSVQLPSSCIPNTWWGALLSLGQECSFLLFGVFFHTDLQLCMTYMGLPNMFSL